MKKLFLALVLVLFACGRDVESAQIGVRVTDQIPEHGHSTAKDGGILKNMTGGVAADSNTVVTANTHTTIDWTITTSDPNNIIDLVNNKIAIPVYANSFDASICIFYSTGVSGNQDTLELFNPTYNLALRIVTLPKGTLMYQCISFLNVLKSELGPGIDFVAFRYYNSDNTNNATIYGTTAPYMTNANIRLYR